MAEQEYFKKALSNFAYEAASGGEIRHLADLGYTVKQIMEQLDFPTPYGRVQNTVWEHLLHTGVLLSEEPGNGKQRESVSYVKEYDKYGKASFRQVSDKKKIQETICWEEHHFEYEEEGNLAKYLLEKCEENGEAFSYVSCDFGLRGRRESGQYQEMLKVLEEPHREYILGLPWESKVIYHRLDVRMREIVEKLYECGKFHGNCYFMKTKEKIMLS